MRVKPRDGRADDALHDDEPDEGHREALEVVPDDALERAVRLRARAAALPSRSEPSAKSITFQVRRMRPPMTLRKAIAICGKTPNMPSRIQIVVNIREPNVLQVRSP